MSVFVDDKEDEAETMEKGAWKKLRRLYPKKTAGAHAAPTAPDPCPTVIVDFVTVCK